MNKSEHSVSLVQKMLKKTFTFFLSAFLVTVAVFGGVVLAYSTLRTNYGNGEVLTAADLNSITANVNEANGTASDAWNRAVNAQNRVGSIEGGAWVPAASWANNASNLEGWNLATVRGNGTYSASAGNANTLGGADRAYFDNRINSVGSPWTRISGGTYQGNPAIGTSRFCTFYCIQNGTGAFQRRDYSITANDSVTCSGGDWCTCWCLNII